MIFSVTIVVFVLLIFFMINEPDSGIRTTTSTALQEIWSGACARRCLTSQNYRTIRGYSYQVPDYNNCSCDTCTCALSGNAIRTCNLITTLNTIMNSINEIVHNVYETVRATYDYVFEVVQGMFSQTQMPEEGNLINVTNTSGSEQTMTVTRPEPEPKPQPQSEAVPQPGPQTVSAVAPKVEKIKNDNAFKKTTGEVKTSLHNAKTTQPGESPAKGPPPSKVGEAKDTPTILNNTVNMAIVGIEPMKQEVGTEAQKLTSETTSPKCTRCIEKNVFCNQDCPNTTNVDRID